MTAIATMDRFSLEVCRSTVLRVLDRTNAASRPAILRMKKQHFGCLVILDRRDGSSVYEECLGVFTPGIKRMLESSARKRVRGRVSGDAEAGKGAISTENHALAWVSEEGVVVDELITVAIASRLGLFTLEEANGWLKLQQNPFTSSQGDYRIARIHYLALLGYREHSRGHTVFMDEK